jgi:hypothetical protein
MLTVIIDLLYSPRMWALPKWRERSLQERSFDTKWIFY